MGPPQHHHWMAEALRQARRGLYTTHPNPRVGCVIVYDDRLLATGWHAYTGGPHAEANAIAAAPIPPGADFYVTLEPCSHHGRTPPCADAVIAARPARVIVAMLDPNPDVGGRGLERIRAAGIEVITGVLEKQARDINRGFVKRMQQGKPYVSIKMACSLDGRSALGNGVSRWISGEAARHDVQLLRAQASAILSSAETILSDDPSLNLRLSAGELGISGALRQPVRVVVDSGLRLNGDERIFSSDGEVWIYTTRREDEKMLRFAERGVSVTRLQAGEGGHVDLLAMLRDMARRGINDVHTECGQALAGALIRHRLADQLVLYLAPHLLGSAARGCVDLGELTRMEQRVECKLNDIRQVGDDLRLTLGLNQE